MYYYHVLFSSISLRQQFCSSETMKFVIATIAFLIVSVSALRQFDPSEIDFNNERSVSSYIKNTMQDVSESIKAVGWDPLYIQRKERNYTLPVPVIFNSGYFIEEFLSNGLSNIVVNSASYSIISSRLSFDIEMPLIDASVGAGSMETTVFGRTFKMNSSGKVAVQRMRFVGQVRINFNFTTGITIKSTKVNFTMGGIESDVKLVVQDEDYSDKMNEFFNITVPETFKEYRNEIDELLGIMLKDCMNEYLKTQKN
ncbi:hypothetical protein PYW08_014309 [Mythimna loreyi]|uniref:Uncharacterized protein n=1 Tax=Mythimna loreyi TaxID=667449 RepID=A0ACC2R6Z9_9NEOP|nr:hypothetical protein PYW08_014309 [Mythimna loreyi]